MICKRDKKLFAPFASPIRYAMKMIYKRTKNSFPQFEFLSCAACFYYGVVFMHEYGLGVKAEHKQWHSAIPTTFTFSKKKENNFSENCARQQETCQLMQSLNYSRCFTRRLAIFRFTAAPLELIKSKLLFLTRNTTFETCHFLRGRRETK